MSSDEIRAAWPMRVGIVKQQDLSMARVRVVFPELDQMMTYWLPIVVQKTQNDKAYWIPDIGEQVICMMDPHYEAGVVLGAIYSQSDPTPVASANKFHLGFKDGAAFEYDRAAHVLSMSFADGTSITYNAGTSTLNLSGGAAASVQVSVPNGVTLSSGGASIRINPAGDGNVHISPAPVTP